VEEWLVLPFPLSIAKVQRNSEISKYFRLKILDIPKIIIIFAHVIHIVSNTARKHKSNIYNVNAYEY